MKAIRLHARGGPETFAYEEASQPRPGEGEVLIRVHAAAVTQPNSPGCQRGRHERGSRDRSRLSWDRSLPARLPPVTRIMERSSLFRCSTLHPAPTCWDASQ